MFVLQIGNVNFHYLPLLIILVFLAILAIVRILILRRSWKCIGAAHQAGEYDKVIITADKLLKRYRSGAKIISNYNVTKSIETLNLFLAISYFAKLDYDNFLQHIDQVQTLVNEKSFYLALYSLLHDRLEAAREYYDHIDDSEAMQGYKIFLEGICLQKQGETEKGKEKLESIRSKISHPFLREIADQFMA